MYYFVEIACVITEIWMIHMFLKSFFPRSRISKWVIAVFDWILGGVITVLSLDVDMAFVRLGVTMVGVLTYSQLGCKTNFISGVISGVAFCAIVAVTDTLSTLAFQFCGIDTNALLVNHISRSLYLIAGHFILFGTVMLVCSINGKSSKQISIKVLLPISPCWIVSILLCVLLAWQCYVLGYEWHPLLLVVLLGLLYTNIILIYYINSTNERARIQKDFEIAEHHYAMQQEYYDQFRVQQEETRALWHDISKYLRASRAEASQCALNQVQEILNSIACVVDVNNRVVSVILNEYVQTARIVGIELEMDVQIPEVLFVTAADLYVLIGNTLDNAIEACQRIPQEKRKITLKLRMHNNILFYEISNPFADEHLRRVRNNYHGFGLKNVKRCVEKYNGKMDVSKEKGVFSVTVHLNSI